MVYITRFRPLMINLMYIVPVSQLLNIDTGNKHIINNNKQSYYPVQLALCLIYSINENTISLEQFGYWAIFKEKFRNWLLKSRVAHLCQYTIIQPASNYWSQFRDGQKSYRQGARYTCLVLRDVCVWLAYKAVNSNNSMTAFCKKFTLESFEVE